ncbi:hypothetical protein R4P64_33200 [Rhodococcus sp. IEGM 1366]|uniref:hypothetical protein n=1 Tax=Rhodococcus sp. IEGM 1366 TaxID=3082223 RepID=UPI0029540629|nr:hypothetical protein [Rhodococcus sp. IEGM 1366]MDV8071371.1 hypothetical protein [Rhodococcus sp. IEGM 1366]
MTQSVQLTAGLRLQSQTCSTEVIVIRPGRHSWTLMCGGVPMVPFGTQNEAAHLPDPGHSAGTVLGKRYTLSGDDSVEMLVTKGGKGSLSDGDVALVFKEARQLPASD